MSAIRSALDEMAAVPSEDLTIDELQGQIAELDSAREILRTLIFETALALVECMLGTDVTDDPVSPQGGRE
jgi:hypothetical protein